MEANAALNENKLLRLACRMKIRHLLLNKLTNSVGYKISPTDRRRTALDQYRLAFINSAAMCYNKDSKKIRSHGL